jgi:hypothetical protein
MCWLYWIVGYHGVCCQNCQPWCWDSTLIHFLHHLSSSVHLIVTFDCCALCTPFKMMWWPSTETLNTAINNIPYTLMNFRPFHTFLKDRFNNRLFHWTGNMWTPSCFMLTDPALCQYKVYCYCSQIKNNLIIALNFKCHHSNAYVVLIFSACTRQSSVNSSVL